MQPESHYVPPAAAEALRMIDKLLAERPEKVGHDFSAATRCLTEFREQLIARIRQHGGTETDRDRLARVNSVLSAIVGGHFPIGSVPWTTIEKARESYLRLLDELQRPV